MDKHLVNVLLVLVLSILYSCGGGGSGGGGGTPPPTLPTVLNYSAGSPAGTQLRLTSPSQTFAVTSMDLAGTYDRTTGATTLSGNKGMTFAVDPDRPYNDHYYVTTTISVQTPAGSTVRWTSGSDPTEGTFYVHVTSMSVVWTNTQITVQVNSSGTGVDVYLDGQLSSSLTWYQFKNEYPGHISDAYNTLQAVYRLISQAYTMVEVVLPNQDTLAQGMITATKTSLNADLPASMSAQWNDVDHSGSIDPGDGFLTRFSNWWLDNPGANQDYIYDGRLLWLDYREGTNSSGTFVGGQFQFGVTGDEFFEREVNGGVPDDATRVTVSGMIPILLSW